ncbi:hypothetical protein QFC21_006922 [Naganishia friedmannii]|uniref:Uncharacterized protein n=1 Tax=Naganishia friedmannii TaxID=89922 RepID=A0ACC2V022_9TREE|nr:hypothetical protein QFC21_006922 [Naganishia friedmannii]
MNQRRYVEAGGTGVIWKEDVRCKLAIEYKLLELETAKERCISDNVFDEKRGWLPIREALLRMGYNKALAELNDFAPLFMTMDKPLKSAIDR